MSDWLVPLLRGLRGLQADLGSEDVADAFWLAAVRGADIGGFEDSQPELRQPPAVPPDRETTSHEHPESEHAAGTGVSEGAVESEPGHDLFLPGGGSGKGVTGRPFRAPGATALPGALQLAQALRPLKHRVESHHRWVLDEEETANRFAIERFWDPALRPDRERWLRAHLVVDMGSSMGLWRQTAACLRSLLESVGAFRDVQVWGLHTDAQTPWLQRGFLRAVDITRGRSPRELVEPSGRQVIMILTDCVCPSWSSGGVARLVKKWCDSGSAATIIQVLPQHMWSRTSLGSFQPVTMSPAGACRPPALAYMQSESEFKEDTELVSVPVLALEPHMLAGWARSLTGSSPPGSLVPGYLLDLDDLPRVSTEDRVEPEATAEDVFEHFWQIASPTARRLATLIAASPVLSLPLIRMIRQAMLPAARQVHEAEILLGGLLEIVIDSDDPEIVQYDFYPGVRDLLLDCTPSPDALRVLTLENVSRSLEASIGFGYNFMSVLKDSFLLERATDAVDSPFADVVLSILLRMGGEYARISQINSQLEECVWRAGAIPISEKESNNTIPKEIQVVKELQRNKNVEENFQWLFDEYYRRLVYFFGTRGFALEDSRDLAQETFVAVYKGIKGFRADSTLKNWILSIARRVALNARRGENTIERSKSSLSVESIDKNRILLSATDINQDVASTVPEDTYISREAASELRSAILELPAQIRNCLLLRIYQERKYREIADIMQISVETVKSHIHQAREKLRKALPYTDIKGLIDDE